MKASVKPRSPALNAVGTAQVHGYRKSLFWWNVWSGSRKAVRHSHTCQRNLRVSPGTKHKRGRLQQRKMLRQSFSKHTLKHMFCLAPLLELTVAISPSIASWNRFERIPVLGDPTLFNAEEVINASGYAT